jgi:hypothetical protein
MYLLRYQRDREMRVVILDAYCHRPAAPADHGKAKRARTASSSRAAASISPATVCSNVKHCRLAARVRHE